MKLYHYRSVKRAQQEIEEGTLWFAKSETLNDPLEGYVQVVWEGDRIAWEGLLKNYILSLYRCLLLFSLGEDQDDLLDRDVIFLDAFEYENLPIYDIFQQLVESFLQNQIVSRFVSFFEKNGECTSDELCYWLRLLHPIAWNLCAEENEKNSIPISAARKRENFDITRLEQIVSSLDDKTITEEEIHELESLSNEMRNLTEVFQIRDYDRNEEESNDEEEIRKARRWRIWQEINYDFPVRYIAGLKRIIYPDGLIVCFSDDVTSSVMWGHYADEHHGVCLIYETVSMEDKDTLPLDNIEREKLTIHLPSEIKPVRYQDSILKRNFFETMGELTMLQIKSWLTNGNNESSCFLTIYDTEEWRNRYWNGFDEKYCTKMSGWEYEKEYRLIIQGYVLDHILEESHDSQTENELKRPKGMAVKYAPNLLKGIVFGLRTNIHDKVKLLRAIKESGRNLKEFKVYEARYDERKREIYILENQLIRHFADEIFKGE